MLVRYLCKRIYTYDEITGYKVGPIVDSNYTPKDHDVLHGAEAYGFKKAILSTINEILQWVVVEDINPKTLKEAWTEMDEGVVQDAAPVFKTTNRESMLAFVDEFQLRIMVPEMFIGDGEISEVVTPSFQTHGESLDTAEKIKTYYAEVLYNLHKQRYSRIRNYLTLKAGLGL